MQLSGRSLLINPDDVKQLGLYPVQDFSPGTHLCGHNARIDPYWGLSKYGKIDLNEGCSPRESQQSARAKIRLDQR